MKTRQYVTAETLTDSQSPLLHVDIERRLEVPAETVVTHDPVNGRGRRQPEG